MIQLVGIGIDRSRAHIVQFDEEGHYTLRTLERDDKLQRPRPSHAAPPEPIIADSPLLEGETERDEYEEYGYFDGDAVSLLARRRFHPWGNNPDRRFCSRVVSSVAGADRVALFGSDYMMGELDTEFRRRPAFLMKLVGVEPFEGKSPAKLVEAVRRYYHLPNPAGLPGVEGSGVKSRRFPKSA